MSSVSTIQRSLVASALFVAAGEQVLALKPIASRLQLPRVERSTSYVDRKPAEPSPRRVGPTAEPLFPLPPAIRKGASFDEVSEKVHQSEQHKKWKQLSSLTSQFPAPRVDVHRLIGQDEVGWAKHEGKSDLPHAIWFDWSNFKEDGERSSWTTTQWKDYAKTTVHANLAKRLSVRLRALNTGGFEHRTQNFVAKLHVKDMVHDSNVPYLRLTNKKTYEPIFAPGGFELDYYFNINTGKWSIYLQYFFRNSGVGHAKDNAPAAKPNWKWIKDKECVGSECSEIESQAECRIGEKALAGILVALKNIPDMRDEFEDLSAVDPSATEALAYTANTPDDEKPTLPPASDETSIFLGAKIELWPFYRSLGFRVVGGKSCIPGKTQYCELESTVGQVLRSVGFVSNPAATIAK